MKLSIPILVSVVTCTVAAAELSPTQVDAKRSLVRAAQTEEYRGGIYAQAKLDGIDYRPILKRAINLDEKALGSLLSMRFIGEGAETHCENLLQLMRLWGDDRFSKVVAQQPAKIRALVVGSIDYAWADPEWNLYSKTRKTSPGSVTKRTKAEQDAAGQPAPRHESK